MLYFTKYKSILHYCIVIILPYYGTDFVENAMPKSGRGVYRTGLPEVVWLACKCSAHRTHGTYFAAGGCLAYQKSL